MNITDIATRLASQDNRGTALPIFVVQQRVRIYGMDPEYTDTFTWIDAVDGDDTEVDTDEAVRLEDVYQETGNIEGGYRRVSFVDRWEFVTACFTEQGCKDYIAGNGHNLTDPRIYVMSGSRNNEWDVVRTHLMGLRKLIDRAKRGALGGSGDER